MSDPGTPLASLPEMPPPPTERAPFWGYGDLLIWLALLIPSLGLGLAVTLGIFHLFPSSTRPKIVDLVVAQFVAYGIWLLALAAIFRFRHGRPFWRSLGWVQPPDGFARYLALGPVLALATGAISALLRTPDVQTPMREFLHDPQSFAVLAVLGVSLAPLCEELIFRGFLLPLVARTIGPIPGIVTTALLFGLLHGGQNRWLWQAVVLVGFAGFVFGWVRYRTGSTAASVLMHAGYNMTLFIGYYVALRLGKA
jgi:membrane protease YdiL (CAAX protease family)